jgi:hypothetical protein
VNEPDPQLTINCPKCGKPLRYVSAKMEPAKMYLYLCPQDGMFEISGERFETIRHSSGVPERN